MRIRKSEFKIKEQFKEMSSDDKQALLLAVEDLAYMNFCMAQKLDCYSGLEMGAAMFFYKICRIEEVDFRCLVIMCMYIWEIEDLIDIDTVDKEVQEGLHLIVSLAEKYVEEMSFHPDVPLFVIEQSSDQCELAVVREGPSGMLVNEPSLFA